MRVRLRYTKLGKVRFVSHRDLARVWERAIRRAELPIAYSEGFSPRPKLHFGLALSVGHESASEYVDIDLTSDVDPETLPARLSPCLPDGVDVIGAVVVADYEAALQAVVTSVSWEMVVDGVARDELARRVGELLAADTVPMTVERKGKPHEVDLRPTVLTAEVGDETDDGDPRGAGVVLHVDLVTEGRSVRPAELLAALDVPAESGRVRRLEQWMHIDGVRRPPVAPDTSRSPAAMVAG